MSLVVTPEQLGQGYKVFISPYIFSADYRVICKMSDGNWLVHDPMHPVMHPGEKITLWYNYTIS